MRFLSILLICATSATYANEQTYQHFTNILSCKAIYEYQNDILTANKIGQKATTYAQQLVPEFKRTLQQDIGNMKIEQDFLFDDKFLLGYLLASETKKTQRNVFMLMDGITDKQEQLSFMFQYYQCNSYL